MPVYINFVCEERKDCGASGSHAGENGLIQTISFDSLDETFGDAVKAMKDLGWAIDVVDGSSHTMKVLCPKHAAANQSSGADEPIIDSKFLRKV